MPFGINIDGMAVGKAWGMTKARRELAKFIEPLGKTRIQFVISNNIPVTDCLPASMIDGFREFSKKPLYKRFADILTDEDVISLLPKSMLEVIIEQGPQGRAWCRDNIRLIRRDFFGQEVPDGGQANQGEPAGIGRRVGVQHQDPGPAEFE